MAILRTYNGIVESLGPLARWRFNETNGNGAIDRAGDLDGTYNGTPQLVAGVIGDGAARFDGGDFVEVISSSGGSGAVTVAVFGDSLAAGFGVSADDSFPDDLQDALVARGLDTAVLNRGVGGETTGDALSRVDSVIAEHPDVVVIVLGTNDARDQVPLATVEGNLRSIVSDLRDSGVEVVLTGTFGFFPDSGGYATEAERDAFEQLFPDLAADFGVQSEHFFGGTREGEIITGGVIGDGQTVDGLHPDAEGVDRIVEKLLPEVSTAIDASGAGQPAGDALALAQGALGMWFTPDQVSGRQALFSKDAAGPGAGQVRGVLDDGRIRVTLESASGSSTLQSPAGSVAAGEATHLVFVFGAAGIFLFLNGERVDRDSAAGGGLTGNTEPLLIGRAQSGPAADFQGIVDEVLIYDQALDAQEVAALYDAGLSGGILSGTAGADELIGSAESDDLRGLGGDDVLRGLGGNDKLRGGAGADELLGGPGDDVLIGNGGPDRLSGGAGDDVLRGGGGKDVLYGQGGADRMYGGGGKDVMHGNAGADLMFGGAGADRLFGNLGADELHGDGGNDRLAGGAGDDTLLGGPGKDALFGNAGDDLLDGGPGDDLLVGGPGADTYRLSAIGHGLDTVRGFEAGPGGDALEIGDVLDGFVPGTSDPAAFVQLSAVGGDTEVAVNPDGGGGDAVTVFRLTDLAGLDLQQLVGDGNLVLA